VTAIREFLQTPNFTDGRLEKLGFFFNLELLPYSVVRLVPPFFKSCSRRVVILISRKDQILPLLSFTESLLLLVIFFFAVLWAPPFPLSAEKLRSPPSSISLPVFYRGAEEHIDM